MAVVVVVVDVVDDFEIVETVVAAVVQVVGVGVEVAVPVVAAIASLAGAATVSGVLTRVAFSVPATWRRFRSSLSRISRSSFSCRNLSPPEFEAASFSLPLVCALLVSFHSLLVPVCI